MSILTRINNIPVFSTIEKATLWGEQFGLTGYHTHTVLGQTGYMAGQNHNQVVSAVKGGVVPTSIRRSFGSATGGGTTGGSGY
tara:strand:- start:429 stop:677 length:249 start_codon:yes stop_codon:yes gene_type:complete